MKILSSLTGRIVKVSQIAVIGAGATGNGIVQAGLMGGCTVSMDRTETG